MALFILNSGLQPLGEFDVLDTDAANILGGEVMVMDEASRVVTASEKAAYDVLDGYVADEVDSGTPTATRVVARIADEASETYDVFFLADEGKAFYGVTLGSVIGSPVGMGTTGTNLGPHTTAGSGKVTLWDKPGTYAVSYDAVGGNLNPRTGNLNDTPLPGTVLYRETLTGKLTEATGTGDKIASFIELTSNGSLVTTPGRLVGAAESFDRLKIYFFGANHNA
jgi:hypothetical protein